MERRERRLLPRLDDAVDHVRADVAYGAEAEADVFADGGEVADGLAHIGRQHPDAHAPALVQVDRQLVLRSPTLVSSAAMYSAG